MSCSTWPGARRLDSGWASRRRRAARPSSVKAIDLMTEVPASTPMRMSRHAALLSASGRLAAVRDGRAAVGVEDMQLGARDVIAHALAARFAATSANARPPPSACPPRRTRDGSDRRAIGWRRPGPRWRPRPSRTSCGRTPITTRSRLAIAVRAASLNSVGGIFELRAVLDAKRTRSPTSTVGVEHVHRRLADEGGDEEIGRPLLQLGLVGELLQHAALHDRDAIGERVRLGLVVGDEDRRHAALDRAIA